MGYVSGSESLDSSEVEELLTVLHSAGVPNTRTPVRRRAQEWAQIADRATRMSELASAIARRLASADWGR